jgi:hypothetical protein
VIELGEPDDVDDEEGAVLDLTGGKKGKKGGGASLRGARFNRGEHFAWVLRAVLSARVLVC